VLRTRDQVLPEPAYLALALFALAAVWGTLRQWARERAQRRFDALVQAHLPALRRKRRQLVRTDDYGLVDRARWDRELGYFMDRVVLGSLAEADARQIRERPDRFLARLEAAVAAGAPDAGAEARFAAVRTGQEFELFCAGELERGGWRVTLTGPSRDQGADLVAERRGERLVVQCKLLGRPIGNHAVQEVVAARSHRQADRALVASNQRFTASCTELAAANRVELRHWSELARL
jgi:restriction system protein